MTLVTNSHRRCEAGSALVELAVSLPLLLLVLFGTADFARVFYHSIALSNAARAGAQYGAADIGNSGDTAGIQAAAVAAVNITGVSATALRVCFCAPNDGSSFNSTCTATFTCTSSSQHPMIEVNVTTTKTFTTTGRYPGVPNTIALSRQATMRVPN